MRDIRSEILLMMCLCAAVAIPFLPVLGGQFTNWDDPITVTENPYVLRGFAHGLIPLVSRARGELYVPVTYVVYWVGTHLWGVNAFGFHLLNLLIHTVNVALVYNIFRRLSLSAHIAFPAALWWGVHPVHVESVAWVTGLKEVLSVFLILISLRLYMAWRGSELLSKNESGHGWTAWLWSLVAFVLSCFSKPSVVAFPLVLIGYDLLVARRRLKDSWVCIPYLLVSALVVAITVSVQETHERGIVALDMLGRLRIAADSTLFYLQKLLWPAKLSPVYGRTISEVLDSGTSWVRLLLAAGILAAAVFPNWRWRFAVVIFAAGFLPISGIVPFGYQLYSTVADRYVYFSAIGAALVMGDVASCFCLGTGKRLSGRALVIVVCIMLWAGVLGRATWIQARIWGGSLSLWNRVIELRPNMAMGYDNRAIAWQLKGNLDWAIDDYTRALQLKSDDAEVYNNRGVAWQAKGDYGKAIEDATQAIRLQPTCAESYYNRGRAKASMGNWDDALADYTRAIELKEDFAEAYRTRGIAWSAKGQIDRAILDFREAIRSRPDYAEAYNGLGAAIAKQGDSTDAIENFTTAINLKPDYLKAYYNRGLAWADRGNYVLAAEDFTVVLAINPDYAEVYNNRAVAYYFQGKYQEAWADVRQCRKLGGPANPEFVEALKKASEREQ